MLFSENKWNDAAELNQFIPVSSALSFEKMESSFRDAEELFILPLFGQKLMERVQKIYNEGADNGTDKKLLHLLQTAEANLAWWYNFDELNTRITDQGVQRQVSENFTSAYKYQEENLRTNFKTKGFNAIDNAIEYCVSKMEEIPEFKESLAWMHRSTAMVKGLREAESIWSINGSSLNWMRLEPIIREVEVTVLPSVIGETAYDALVEGLKGESEFPPGYSVEDLRVKVARFLVTHALAKMIRRSGAITDRGLYFDNVVATAMSGDSSTSADRERLIMLAQEIEKTSEAYRRQLVRHIETKCPLLFTGRESSVLDRDNDDKKAFFA